MATRTSSPEFRNWAGNQVCLPSERLMPTSLDEVVAVVIRAANAGLRVKVVGAGHSFTDAACTDGIQLSLDKLNAVESIDRTSGRVTVQAGIRLYDLNDRLAEAGLAMPNLGDIAYQSIAGAIGTATHGTGLAYGNLATTIVGMELVTGSGEVLWCDEEVNRDIFRSARVGVGALGIVTRVVIQCVPAFNLRVAETIESLTSLLDNFHEYATAVDHFEFFWVPGTDNAQVKRNERTFEAASPPSRAAYFRDKILAENVGFGLINRVGRRIPSVAPKVATMLAAGISERSFVDRSDRVFASPRRVKFYEMEYGIPVEALPEAFGRVRDYVAGLAIPNFFPIECRVSAADDIPLSTACGRTSAWIACHVYQGTSYDAYFQGVEQIMNDYEGRPHWGKLHFQSATTLAPRYPDWDAFASVRERVDPDRRFANAYTNRVLGA
ncbi:MAG: D-arabinono-1,4-lactone oxidase [Acidimicrobiales bacterium]